MNKLLRFFLASLVAGAAPSAFAQTEDDDSPPPWVVPVLRLVSSTHVEPTTGIVLSSSGQVLVPLSFGGDGDEIVVLDGGNDIVQNGRPARTVLRFPDLGLKVLAVDGLRRAAAPVAAATAGGEAVYLAAFPPAEQIEKGEPPLHREAMLLAGSAGDPPTFAADPPLPNVTGALLDACDNLVAYSMAAGTQDMAPSPGTLYRWQDALATVRGALGLAPEGRHCRAPDAPAADRPGDENVAAPEPSPAEDEPQLAVQDDSGREEPPPQSEPPVTELPIDEASLDRPAPAPEQSERSPSLWWLGGALLLFAAGWALHRWRKALAAGPANPASSRQDSGEDAAAAPGAAPPAQQTDARLVLRGQYADGRALQVSTAVSSQAVDVEIGRGDADLSLESRAISRRHARIGGEAGALTLSDLGSGNGSSINGVPCLEGEIMYLETGDTVILGDVRFTVDLEVTGKAEA